ncbi:unnamed protein product [Arabidopsis lyrata]|nr:unnamed protein product [Arabidopsis lyrata]
MQGCGRAFSVVVCFSPTSLVHGSFCSLCSLKEARLSTLYMDHSQSFDAN